MRVGPGKLGWETLERPAEEDPTSAGSEEGLPPGDGRPDAFTLESSQRANESDTCTAQALEEAEAKLEQSLAKLEWMVEELDRLAGTNGAPPAFKLWSAYKTWKTQVGSSITALERQAEEARTLFAVALDLEKKVDRQDRVLCVAERPEARLSSVIELASTSVSRARDSVDSVSLPTKQKMELTMFESRLHAIENSLESAEHEVRSSFDSPREPERSGGIARGARTILSLAMEMLVELDDYEAQTPEQASKIEHLAQYSRKIHADIDEAIRRAEVAHFERRHLEGSSRGSSRYSLRSLGSSSRHGRGGAW